MKSKPIKSGFKLWSRYDDRVYTYQFEIYHGTRIGNAEAKRNRKNEATDQVFLDLCAPLANNGHIVAFDSFFTSVSVMDKLYESGTNAVGTINRIRVNQPIMQEKLLKQDEFRAKVGGQTETCRKSLFLWKDTKAFRVLSYYHDSDTVVVQRKQRDGTYLEKLCPKAMADYSKFMGGIDTAIQLRSYYERDRRSKKWWHRLFFALLETSLVNAWICFNDLLRLGKLKDYTEPMSLLDFKCSVAIGHLR
jgi:hypothetical protein